MGIQTDPLKRIERFRREDRLVRRLLEAFGLLAQKDALIAMQNQHFDIPYLTLRAWRCFYPSFPVYLGYELLYDLGNESSACKIRDLASEAWYEFAGVVAAQHMDDGRPVGLVFPYRGLNYGMTLHNGAYYCRRYRIDQDRFETEDGHVLTIEPTRYVIQAIHESGWEPDVAWEASENRIAPAPLLRGVRTPAAKLVLSLLINALNGDLERHPDWLGGERPEQGEARTGGVLPGETVVRVEGLRHVLLTQGEIADALGLSDDQVRSALRLLRELELVASHSHEGMYAYRVLKPEA